MNSLLAKTIADNQLDWPQRIPHVVSAYNSSVHEVTGYTPNILVFGRNLDTPAVIALGNPNTQRRSVNDYVQHTIGLMTEAFDEVRESLSRAAETAKCFYDFNSKSVVFNESDLVWLYNPRRYQGKCHKW